LVYLGISKKKSVVWIIIRFSFLCIFDLAVKVRVGVGILSFPIFPLVLINPGKNNIPSNQGSLFYQTVLIGILILNQERINHVANITYLCLLYSLQ
jgi:hypothetical protein